MIFSCIVGFLVPGYNLDMLCLDAVVTCSLTLSMTKDMSTENFVGAMQMLPIARAWVIEATAKFTPPNGATVFISTVAHTAAFL